MDPHHLTNSDAPETSSNSEFQSNASTPESWVYFTSVPARDAMNIGLILGSQGIAYIPSHEGPETFLSETNSPINIQSDNSQLGQNGFKSLDANEESTKEPSYYLPPPQFRTPHHQKHGPGKIAIYIQQKHLYKAHNQLFLWHQENHENNAPKIQSTPIPELSLAPLAILIIPVFFYLALPFTGIYPQLKEQGINSAKAVLGDSEWWRLWTALTLHADHKHLMSNLLSGYFVLNLLRTRFTTIWQFTTLTAMSGLANFLVVYTHGYDIFGDHRSLGFSTFVFAALGMLAAVETRLIWKNKEFTLKRFTPFTSAFFIVIMLGLGEGTDILAHVYGFFMGAIPGFFAPLRKSAFNLHFEAPEINGQIKPPSNASLSLSNTITWVLCVSWFVLCWQLAIL